MCSVLSAPNPDDLDVSMEITKPEVGWMDMQAWTSPQGDQSLDNRRLEFARFEATLSKGKSVLGFDKGMAPMRPADVLRSTAHIPEDSTGYPFSDTGGRVIFTQILTQLIACKNDFLGAHTVYLIVDSRLPHSVEYWPAFQPWWASREQIVGPHKEVTRLVWYHINDQSRVQYVPHIWAGVFVLLVARFLGESVGMALPLLPPLVYPCVDIFFNFGSPTANSVGHNGCCPSRSLLFICQSFIRGNAPRLTTPQGNHWVLLAVSICPSQNPMHPCRPGDHWVFSGVGPASVSVPGTLIQFASESASLKK